jgi:hypothetical protein
MNTKNKLGRAGIAAAAAAIGGLGLTGKIGRFAVTVAILITLGAAGSVVQPMTASAATQQTVVRTAASRGNVTQEQSFWWGARIWLDHNATQAAWRQVQASGNLSNLQIPGVPRWITLPLKYISCVGQFVNDVRADDVGYGVVMDINWWAPWWSCGTLKVWSQ